jgi:hypothetical protein
MFMHHDPVMTVVDKLYVFCYTPLKTADHFSEERKDACAADEHYIRKLAAERRAEQIAYLKELFMSWLRLPFRTAASSEKHTALILDQSLDLIHQSGGNLKLPEKDL